MNAKEYMKLLSRLRFLIEEKVGLLSDIEKLKGCSCHEEEKEVVGMQLMECFRIQEQLFKLLSKLNAKDCELLAMIYIKDLNYNEVAKLKGTNYAQVCTAHNRALRRLQHIINEENIKIDTQM